MLYKKFVVIEEEFGVHLPVGTKVKVLEVLDCEPELWDVFVQCISSEFSKRYMNSEHLKEIE